MKRYLLAALITSTLVGCASAGWKENDFFINGKTVSLSPTEMAELRNAWSVSTPFAQFKTSLTPSEAQWTADFISLRESFRDRSNPCRKLTLTSISPSPEDITNLSGRHTPSSQLDEKWDVEACGVKRAYRAFHPQYSTALAIEEARQ